MLVFRMSLPYSRYNRIRWYARKFLSTCVPAVAPQEVLLTAQEDESQTQSDGPEILHLIEGNRADDSLASVNSLEGDEKLNGDVALGGIAGASVANAHACAECGVKMRGIFYVCITCSELHDAIALCGDCAFRDAFDIVTDHHPYKHWLVKIKDRVQDVCIEASEEPLADVDETTSLSLRDDKLAAMVESRFVELDLRLSALVTQVEQLVHSIAALAGKAELPSESESATV
ncbi:uncharacterized protein EDB93DRAFT_603503 [Suillus bovinus]|uniref:uncharacterized protein n=1 Tax=Suillus bovinus TaxID=48563 RepID=UPI001B868145|nr:uncharacterized protein EDB93DRAFT_603503 [Suillus bovinus]KAG2142767.1 hypothetical protein EDB93DRAFT_603503 [Suillus bovinus]